MKPLRLVMQAVGPYPGRQVLDFRPALDSGLFGIYGATGSGKSTIFSAMTFALFGKLPRAEQDAPTLRSDHADAGLMTEVELVFDAGQRTYRVVRWPEQTRPAKRGGGETVEAHKAWLYDVTGLDLDKVGAAEPGKVVAESKVTLVDDAVERILGYGAEQFRQIVLLPQGRFEAFLAAKPDDRRVILRDLFDVSLYRRLTERLKADAQQADEEIRAGRATVAALLASESLAGGDALDEAIHDARLKLEDGIATEARSRRSLETAEAALAAGRQLAQLFEERSTAERQLAEIDADRGEIEKSRARLAAARRALALATDEADVSASRAAAEAAANNLVKCEARHKEAARAASDAAAKLAKLEAASFSVEQQRADLGRLSSLADVLRASEAVALLASDMADATARDRKTADGAEQAHATARRAHADAEAAAARAREAEARSIELKAAGAELNVELQAAERYEAAVAAMDRARNELSVAEALQEREAARLGDRQRAAERIEAALSADHALHLAARLESGQPCPVCGSPEHPAPARGVPGSGSSREDLARARGALDIARAAMAKADGAREAAHIDLRSKAAAVRDLVAPARAAKVVAADLARRREEYAALGARQTTDEADGNVKRRAADVERTRLDAETARARAAASDKAAAVAAAELAARLAPIPEAMRDARVLDAETRRLSDHIARHEQDLRSARQNEREGRDREVGASSDLASARAVLEETSRKAAAADDAFTAKLAAQGWSRATYATARADVDAIDRLDQQVREHGEKRAAAEARLSRAADAVRSAQLPDMAALTAARHAAAEASRAAIDAAAAARSRLDQLERLKRGIGEQLARLDRREQETVHERELARALSGQNPARINLEAFAIATMFDRVLEAANQRFAHMTQGRYALVRDVEGKGNEQRGLGISVDDAYTGRRRPASTLSGGETFMAALSLALGLSDVVESARGAVRLDTIFIDEGFGSLDSDGDGGTLERVLATLQDLAGRHRAVGIISHVPLVQQAIPNGFWITRSEAGSRVETRI